MNLRSDPRGLVRLPVSRRCLARVTESAVLLLLVALAFTELAFCSDIHKAAHDGDLATVKALVQADPELVSSQDGKGWTPLHWAADGGYWDVAAFLLANKADVNAREKNGITPLMLAAKKGNQYVVEILVANKADINAKDRFGETAEVCAIQGGQWKVASYLRQLSAPSSMPQEKPTQPAVASGGAPAVTGPENRASNGVSTPADSALPTVGNNFNRVADLTDDQIQAGIQRGIDDKAAERGHAFADPALSHYSFTIVKFNTLGVSVDVLSDSDRVALAASMASHVMNNHGIRSPKPNFTFTLQDARASAIRFGVVTVVMMVSGYGKHDAQNMRDFVGSALLGGTGAALSVKLNADGKLIEPLTRAQYLAVPGGTRIWLSDDYFRRVCTSYPGDCASLQFVFPVVEGVKNLTIVMTGANGLRLEKELDANRFMAR